MFLLKFVLKISVESSPPAVISITFLSTFFSRVCFSYLLVCDNASTTPSVSFSIINEIPCMISEHKGLIVINVVSTKISKNEFELKYYSHRVAVLFDKHPGTLGVVNYILE